MYLFYWRSLFHTFTAQAKDFVSLVDFTLISYLHTFSLSHLHWTKHENFFKSWNPCNPCLDIYSKPRGWKLFYSLKQVKKNDIEQFHQTVHVPRKIPDLVAQVRRRWWWKRFVFYYAEKKKKQEICVFLQRKKTKICVLLQRKGKRFVFYYANLIATQWSVKQCERKMHTL